MPDRPDYSHLFSQLRAEGLHDWVELLEKKCRDTFAQSSHGDFDKWWTALEQLPGVHEVRLNADSGPVQLTGALIDADHQDLQRALMAFHPWRKGPFELFGLPIDTEWRSDWKWARLSDAVELRNRSVLDVGCGNGYYGWKMLAAGARRVIGLDPFLLYVMQHQVLLHYLQTSSADNYVLPVGDDCVPRDLRAFDVVFSMGVLYHRASPIDHLQTLCGALRPGGQLVLETLIIDTDDKTVLVPEGRYARMRNVWFIPSVSMLATWLKRTGCVDIEVVDVTVTTVDEQRRTEWMTFESLADFLDPADPSRTVEGYPAPVRAIVTATKRS